MIAMLLNEIRLLQDEDSDWCSRGIRSRRVSMVGNDVLRNSSFDQSLSMEAVKYMRGGITLPRMRVSTIRSHHSIRSFIWNFLEACFSALQS